jgi:hypothetical protein
MCARVVKSAQGPTRTMIVHYADDKRSYTLHGKQIAVPEQAVLTAAPALAQVPTILLFRKIKLQLTHVGASLIDAASVRMHAGWLVTTRNLCRSSLRTRC